MSVFPWAPLFTVERSNQPEVTIYGVIAVAGGRSVRPVPTVAIGDVAFPLWTRSLLKPWQLLSHIDILKNNYGSLRDCHFALISGSHTGDLEHLLLLHQILDIAQLKEDVLKCPPALPAQTDIKQKFKTDAISPRPIFHNCSGKHLGYLLSLKAQNQDLSDYLNPVGKQFLPLKKLLAYLLDCPQESFQSTIDGCRLPNYALSSHEMAWLYHWLTNSSDWKDSKEAEAAVAKMLLHKEQIANNMLVYPELIGGRERFDTKLVSGEVFKSNLGLPKMIAKTGADGLLAIGVKPNKKYTDGLGIVIKLASGSADRYFEIVVREIFYRLGLLQRGSTQSDTDNNHIATKFHFELRS